MSNTKPRLLTGDRPTGRLHLGHYVGSLSNRVRLQHQYDSFFIIADLHTLTTKPEREYIKEVPTFIREIVLDYLAVGIDHAHFDGRHAHISRRHAAESKIDQPRQHQRRDPSPRHHHNGAIHHRNTITTARSIIATQPHRARSTPDPERNHERTPGLRRQIDLARIGRESAHRAPLPVATVAEVADAGIDAHPVGRIVVPEQINLRTSK